MDDIIKNTTFPRRWSFRELDFFSGGTSIKVKSDSRVKSVLGAFITLAIYVLLGLATGYYISQFVDEEHPKIQLNSKLQSEPSRFKTASGGIGGMHLFFLISNPSTQAGLTVPYYVNMDTLSSFYTVTSEYIKNRYIIKNGITFKATDLTKPVRLVNCKEAIWFNKGEFQKILTANSLTYFMVKEYGVCAEFDDQMEFYGDEQTNELGRYKFQITPCNKTPGCASQELMNVNGQSVIIGTFQPVANNSRAEDPWDYEFNMDNNIAIGNLLSSKVNFNLKNIEVTTDTGVIISEVRTENRAAIDSVRITYDPVVSMGESIPSVTKNYGVKALPTKPAFELKIISSRKIEQIGRSYQTILDLFGNIGGSLEFIIAIFLVFFHWIENLHVDSRIKLVVAKYLNLPESVRPKSSTGCCKKKQKTTPQLQMLSKDSANVISQVVEAAVSVEEMSYNQIMLRFFLEHTLPNDILQLIPTVTIFRELLQTMPKEVELKPVSTEPSKKVEFDLEVRESSNSTNLMTLGFDFDTLIPKETVSDEKHDSKKMEAALKQAENQVPSDDKFSGLTPQTTKYDRQLSLVTELKPALKSASTKYISPLVLGQTPNSPGFRPRSSFAQLPITPREPHTPGILETPEKTEDSYPTEEIPRESESYNNTRPEVVKQTVDVPAAAPITRNVSLRDFGRLREVFSTSEHFSKSTSLTSRDLVSRAGSLQPQSSISSEKQQRFMKLAKSNLLNAYQELKEKSKQPDGFQEMRLDLLATIQKFSQTIHLEQEEDLFYDKPDLGGVAAFWKMFTQTTQTSG